MAVTLTDEARRYIALLDEETGVTAIDCLVEDDRVVYVVPPGTAGQAIGTDGGRVKGLEARVGRSVRVVEGADTAGAFVANALAPAAVYDVTVSGEDEPVAYVEVDPEDRGVAIGRDGRTIELARRLAKRHFDVADVVLT